MSDGTIKQIDDSARLRGLKRILAQSAIDKVIGDDIQTRYCKRITNEQLIWLIVGLGLFAGKSYRHIFRLLTLPTITVPSRATLTTARKRISAAILEKLYCGVVKLLAKSSAKHPFAFYKGFRLMGIDGTLMDCFDSDVNRQAFGRPSNKTSKGAFPKVRVAALCELGTRAIWKAVIGGYRQSEQKLTLPLFEHLTRGMLLLADRHFGVAPIIYPLFARKTQFLIRVKKSQVFRVNKALSDGSYLSTIYRGKNDRARRRPGKDVRVIRYTHHDPNRTGYEEVHVLATNLFDEMKYPAKELIELYHVRWEEEIAFSEWKVAMGEGKLLRSQSPEMVRQEIWGTLLSHYTIRTLIFRGAMESGVEPLQISFTGALDIVHARLPEAKKSRSLTKRWLADLIREISNEQLPPRDGRINPRKIKKRSKARPTKQDSDRSPPKPNGPFIDNVTISI